MRVLVNIDVPEITPAVAFYTAALGLKLQRMLGDDVAELAGATATIYLVRHDEGTRSASAARGEPRRYVRHWTPVHLDWIVDDLAESARRAVAAGAVQETEIVRWHASRCITFGDPFGHGFCLIEFDEDDYARAQD